VKGKMARLGKKPVKIPEGVKVEIKEGEIYISAKNNILKRPIFQGLDVSIQDNQILIKNTISEKQRKLYKKVDSLQGLMRAYIINMIKGVTSSFEKILEIHGQGYKAEIKGKELVLTLGFSVPVKIEIPQDISVEVVKNTIIFIRGIDKEKIGNFAAKLRAISPPEPYKGTGIRYRGEYIRQKVGKAAVGVTK